ncbi:hypothetical protein BCR39DRAFT_221715 [Naematelia encephala]|uniref:Uncharacterized protein n=1 Tax=Naematelia encephala TaxID=71784 RepID=A0A1Y2AZ07_9TREE|nr:hypothetical protein BCR39DRAFT_221715 [Naematelia encephala]
MQRVISVKHHGALDNDKAQSALGPPLTPCLDSQPHTIIRILFINPDKHSSDSCQIMSAKRPLSPSDSTPPSKHINTANGVTTHKQRIPREARIALAEDIILKGIATVKVDELARKTGLTTQQIRSQLVDNRTNLRKQLLDLVKSMT